MTIPTRPIPTPNHKPPADEFRAYLAEVAQTAIRHCRCAQEMVMIRDDNALAYHLEGLAGSARLARDVLEDFREAHSKREGRRDADG